MHDGIGWDRAAIRALICLAVIASTVPAAISGRSALGGWQLGVGLGAVALLCVAIAAGLRPTRPGGRRAVALALVTVAAACLIAVVLPFGQVIWIPFLAVATVGLSGLGLTPAVALAAVPVVVMAWRSWQDAKDPTALVVNVGAAVAVFVLCIGRVRQREARELAEAQRLVIELERARLTEHEQQRTVAAQLHDVLAHTLSGLIITLQGATLAARTARVPADITARLSTATALATDGLAEARRAVETLHGDPAGTGNDTGELSGWLSQALDRLRTGAGLTVAVTGPVQVLGPEWTDLARSVLMEALTNTIRHAAGAPVRIAFTGPPHPGLTVLSVGDPHHFAERHHPSGGHGLTGLGERARRLGGSLRYGAADNGFLVQLDTAPTRAAP